MGVLPAPDLWRDKPDCKLLESLASKQLAEQRLGDVEKSI
jgi:hypothetical protein